ncbi:serine/arginine repetitive matrix protein 4 [Fundulus heteroclitus]|uniref:serine/arginine repetitive matrix protein 4 n=1 Tax=Fundulus heteroclitus TaxID=8078 RepID=UPI00165A2446|nr:serine/arginine repetitive matrix protein 4 [Fundulus heteroclitus]
MQSPFSLKLDLSGPSRTLASEESTTSTTGFLKLGEKQLFEKFWKGTFKAVATPRPGSVIVASITAHRRVTGSETTASCQPLQTDDGKAADTRVDGAERNGCIKGSGRKHRSHRRARIPFFDGVLSPRAKGKKKKRKSERKRKRRRSPSHSLSPLRKKKKKKKKSSKKSKRHRYTSKKSKHSSSSLKRKRKDERKHKKSSRTHSRRRRRYRRSESDTSSCRSFTGKRHRQKSVVHQAFREMRAAGEETRAALNPAETKWRRTTKSVCKTAPKYRSVLSAGTILPAKPGSKLLNGNGAQDFPSHPEGPRDYDSGNDTSSPPSSKTCVSRASVAENQRSCCQRLASPPEKQRFADRDNGSDSGNSVTSYASSCKPYREDGFSAALFSGNSKSGQTNSGCEEDVARWPKAGRCSQRRSRSSRRRLKTLSSTSRSRSSGSSRHSGRYSRSASLSSCSSYSRSLSNSSDVRRRSSLLSLSSRGSYSKHSADRLRDRKRQSSSRETDLKHTHKVSGKSRRRKSYSPMRKRRRDSPSHLEARRITSARKRPIPYFRPSPSSSNRSTSVSSWSSLFTRSRSRSRSHSASRSRSYSSYRSYSRSSSWNSIFGSHSRSRSRVSLKKRRKTRR